MKISVVVVSYNNGKLLQEAIMSVVSQTRPVDEIIVADDASLDDSRQLIDAISTNHRNIKPIYREKNVGVSANRDLAMRDARGDFVTCLDGDDYFLPTKMEAEARALGNRAEGIAYSDIRIIDRSKNIARAVSTADFARLGPSDRVRWLVRRTRQSPAAMLIPKRVCIRIGGYNHKLRTYEDWDFILRLAAEPLRWLHSGTEGLAHHPGGGLSRQGSLDHLRDELRVLQLNQHLVRQQVGLQSLLTVAGRVVASRSKWALLSWYRARKGMA